MTKSLSRKDNHRKSLLRNLATSLILYEEIKTTTTKAKEIKPIVEHLIQVAKKNNLAARRRLLGYLFDKKAVEKVFEVFVLRYKKIPSGFIKIYKIAPRLGDNAEMVLVKLAPGEPVEIKEPITKEKNAQKAKSKESPKKIASKTAAK